MWEIKASPMFGRVIPLRRVPKKLETLDYRIPHGMHVDVGSLVHIPFRGRKIFGIVRAISKTTALSEKSLQDIGAVFGDESLLSTATLRIAENIAHRFAPPLPAVIMAACPPLQPRKLAGITIKPFPTLRKQPSESRYFWYRTPEEKRTWFLKNVISNGQILIIIPEKWHIAEWVEILPHDAKKELTIITSDLSPKELFEKYFAIRNGKVRVIIGTKIALFAPFIKLDRIYFDFEHSPHHKNWDQAPRYHARDVAVDLACEMHADITIMSHTPSVESAVRLINHPLMRASRGETESRVRVVDLKQEYQKKNFAILSDTTEELLERAIAARKDILVMVHRRGAHTTVTCRDCGRLTRCSNCSLPMIYYEEGSLRCHPCRLTEPLRETCVFCHGPNIAFRGAGTQHVEEKMRERLYGMPYHIARADSDTEMPDISIDAPAVIVGTSRAFPFVRFGRLGLVIFPDIDGFLSIPEYRASLEFVGLVRDVLYFMPPSAMLILQTRDPLRPVVQALREESLGAWYRDELATRKNLRYPPFWSLLKLTYYGATSADAARSADHVIRKLRELTTDNRHAILLPPYPTHPPQKLGRYGIVITMRMPGSVAAEAFPSLLGALALPEGWKVDIDPLQLLS